MSYYDKDRDDVAAHQLGARLTRMSTEVHADYILNQSTTMGEMKRLTPHPEEEKFSKRQRYY